MSKRTHSSKKRFAVGYYIVQITRLALVFVLIVFFPPQNLYQLRAMTESITPVKELAAPTPAPFPVNTSNSPAPDISAEGVVVVDTLSGVYLYEKNPTLRLYPASTTKVMTALIALEEYSLDDVVTVKTVVTEGQIMGLVPGETITVENLLYGILVHSANDGAYALAEHYKEGVEAFVARMNVKAQELFLEDTHFVNPNGFDDPNHYTTVKDLSRLTLVALQNPIIQKIVGVAQITVADTTFSQFHYLKNVNELLGRVPGVSGVKTGYTEIAGQALVTTIQRNGRKILIVMLKSTDRFGETEALVQWVFTNFTWKEFHPPVTFGKTEVIP